MLLPCSPYDPCGQGHRLQGAGCLFVFMRPEPSTKPEAQSLSPEYPEASCNTGHPLAAQIPENRDHFLRSPCPLLVESSFAGMGGRNTGFQASSEPIAVVQRRWGKQATEVCRVHLHQPPPTPWGSHVSPLKTVLRDRPYPLLPPDSGQELHNTSYLVSAWPTPGASSWHTPNIPACGHFTAHHM